MNIGIASPADIRYFLPFFSEGNPVRIIENNWANRQATHTHILIKTFLEQGHYVRLFTTAKEDFIIRGKGIDIYGIAEVQSYPLKYLWSNFINSRRISKALNSGIEDLDVLHCQWTYEFAHAGSRFTGQLPVFCTIRDWTNLIWTMVSPKDKITWSFRWVMNELVFRKTGLHFIANSPYTAALAKRKLHRDIPIIPNSINDSFLRSDKKTPPGRLRILCVSSGNDKRKNIKNLIIGFRKVLEEYPDAELTLVGPSFKKGDPVMEAWRKEGLMGNVILAGFVTHDDLKKYFDEAGIFVCPSIEESFGNILIEGMARKVPVIGGKDSGAVPYVLDFGKAGFLCDVRNPRSIADTIIHVFEHREEAQRKADLAFENLRTHYTASVVAQKHIDLYASQIKQK